MFEKIYESEINASVEALWEFHASADALRLLSPPSRKIEPQGDDLSVFEGKLHVIRFKQFGLPMEWHARISNVQAPNEFTDICEKGPFPYWKHKHQFISKGEKSVLRDVIEYKSPGWIFSSLVNRFVVEPDLDRLFAFRHEATKRALETSTDRS